VAAGALYAAIVDVPSSWPAGWDLGDEVPSDSVDLAEMLAEARECKLPIEAEKSTCASESKPNPQEICKNDDNFSAPLQNSDGARVIPFSTLGAAAVQAVPKQGQAGKPFRFPIIPLTAMKLVLDGQWAIHGLLPRKGLAVVYGAPACGKSFLTLDAMLHVASGKEWAGRIVERANVLYIAAEGQAGFQNRVLTALDRLKLDAEQTRFALICVTPNLGTEKGDAQALIEEIRCQSDSLGWAPDIIVIDTLSRVMFGADESSPEGMGAFITNCGLIASAFDGLALAVHHKGKDESKGMRGWSGLHGAADAEWEVTCEDLRHIVTVQKMKDGQDGLSWDFSMPIIEIGTDKYGKPVTTRIVECEEAAQHQAGPKNIARREPSGQAAEFLKVIKWTIEDVGETLPPLGRIPPHVRGVRKDALAIRAKSLDFLQNVKPNIYRAKMSHHIRKLAGDGYIGQWEDYVWLL
jgi:hypothetical protein